MRGTVGEQVLYTHMYIHLHMHIHIDAIIKTSEDFFKKIYLSRQRFAYERVL